MDNGGSTPIWSPSRVARRAPILPPLPRSTWDRTELQPGFEDVDTSVIGCVPFYGIYDLLVRNPTRFDWPFIARYVLKADKQEAPDLYRLGSPYRSGPQ